MIEKLGVSIQTGTWYKMICGGDSQADKAFEYISSLGIKYIDYNFNTAVPSYDKIKENSDRGIFGESLEAVLEYYAPIKEAALRYGVSFGQSHAPFPMYIEESPEHSEFLIDAVNKMLAVCQYLGCPAIVVHPYFNLDTLTKEQEIEINLNMYRKLMPEAKKRGVKICLENMFAVKNHHVIGTACSSAEEACWYIDTLNAEAGEDIFGYCFDVGHANISGKNLRRELNTLGHRLTCLHIHDNDGQNDLHQCPYTQKYEWGRKFCTDWEGFIEGLRDINYEGTLNFETGQALAGLPVELAPSMIRLIADVGAYFKKRISE